MSARCVECGTPLDEVPLVPCAAHKAYLELEPKWGECGSCQFFASGRCQRFPPIYAGPSRSRAEFQAGQPTFHFPETHAGAWCGEYKSVKDG